MTRPAPDEDPAIAPSALTYVELWRGAELLIRKAGEEQSGSRWVFLSVLMLLSFCLEAYLNHAGPLLFGAAWNEGRQAHSNKDVKARLRLVCAACAVKLEAPYKYRTVALTLLELRESLGQATQVRLSAPGETTARRPLPPDSASDPAELALDPAWSPYCERNVVLEYRTQLRSLLAKLHAGLPQQGRGPLSI
ncbi:hypothetical protein [Herbaspirillum huttiense]|uniref:hypothetical protein n=1 Tax=Herbaspirillum huttiense TaxID=863372 RepID=UPI0039AFC991